MQFGINTDGTDRSRYTVHFDRKGIHQWQAGRIQGLGIGIVQYQLGFVDGCPRKCGRGDVRCYIGNRSSRQADHIITRRILHGGFVIAPARVFVGYRYCLLIAHRGCKIQRDFFGSFINSNTRHRNGHAVGLDSESRA